MKTSVRAYDASTKIETKRSETIISLLQEKVDDASEKKDETSLDSNISTMGSYLGKLSSEPTYTSPVSLSESMLGRYRIGNFIEEMIGSRKLVPFW